MKKKIVEGVEEEMGEDEEEEIVEEEDKVGEKE